MRPSNNPSFGAGFNSGQFREIIRSTMQMGLPNTVRERPTFVWDAITVHSGPTNAAGKPFDFNAPPVSVNRKEPLEVDCAVEHVDRMPDGTPLGQFENPRAVIYIMDEDFPLIEGATGVLLGGNLYKINYVAPPLGLFDFTLYAVHCQAEDES